MEVPLMVDGMTGTGGMEAGSEIPTRLVELALEWCPRLMLVEEAAVFVPLGVGGSSAEEGEGEEGTLCLEEGSFCGVEASAEEEEEEVDDFSFFFELRKMPLMDFIVARREEEGGGGRKGDDGKEGEEAMEWLMGEDEEGDGDGDGKKEGRSRRRV